MFPRETKVRLTSKFKSARARARKKLESKTARKKLDSKTTLVSPLSTLKLLSLSSAVDSIHLPDSSLVEVEANGHIAMPELDGKILSVRFAIRRLIFFCCFDASFRCIRYE